MLLAYIQTIPACVLAAFRASLLKVTTCIGMFFLKSETLLMQSINARCLVRRIRLCRYAAPTRTTSAQSAVVITRNSSLSTGATHQMLAAVEIDGPDTSFHAPERCMQHAFACDIISDGVPGQRRVSWRRHTYHSMPKDISSRVRRIC